MGDFGERPAAGFGVAAGIKKVKLPDIQRGDHQYRVHVIPDNILLL